MIGIDLIIMYIALGGFGLFGVNKVVDLAKHSMTIEADKYSSCTKNAESVRECRNLE